LTILYTFDIKNCNLYDSFAITSPAGTPIHFSVGHFATAANIEPSVSAFPFYYKILLIVEDTEESDPEERLVAICQFYRYAHDRSVKMRKKYSKFEVPLPFHFPIVIFLSHKQNSLVGCKIILNVLVAVSHKYPGGSTPGEPPRAYFGV
jgi:hypothetical protein